jgi:hypothetical protein
MYRYTGVQCTTAQVYRYTGVQVYRCTGVQVYRCTGVPVYRCTGVQVYSMFSAPDHYVECSDDKQ